jgi:hypothetical protein
MGERQNASIEGDFGGGTMRREIINSEDTDQPFYCSEELIEQGVANFKPILEKACVFGVTIANVNSFIQQEEPEDGFDTGFYAKLREAYNSKFAESREWRVESGGEMGNHVRND